MLDVFLDFLLGMVLGCLGGLFGIGGGLLAIPALGVIFGLDQQLAQGTALVMVVPNVVLALWRYHQRNRIDPRQAGVLALTGLLCAFLASSVAARIDAARMREAFVIFLLALAGYMFWRLFRRPPRGATPRYGLPWMGVLGWARARSAGFRGRWRGAGDTGADFGVRPRPGRRPGPRAGPGRAEHGGGAGDPPCTAMSTGGWGSPGAGRPAEHFLGREAGPRLPERSLRMAFCAFLALCAVLLLVRG